MHVSNLKHYKIVNVAYVDFAKLWQWRNPEGNPKINSWRNSRWNFWKNPGTGIPGVIPDEIPEGFLKKKFRNEYLEDCQEEFLEEYRGNLWKYSGRNWMESKKGTPKGF